MNPITVSEPVRYVTDDGDKVRAAIVTHVHDDGCVCLAYWCHERKAWFCEEHVARFAQSDADRNESYFLRAGEAEGPAE